MRLTTLAIAACSALALGACSQEHKAADAKADAVKANANVAATNLETKADAAKDAGHDASADKLNKEADTVRDRADKQADAVKSAAERNADASKKADKADHR